MSFPASLQLIILTGEFLDGDGDPRPGVVTVTLPVAIRSEADNVVVPPFQLEQDLVDGALAIELPATTDPDWLPFDGTAEYIIQATFTDDFVKLWWQIPLPHDTAGGTVNLADVGAPNIGTPSETVLQGGVNGASDGGYRGPFVSSRLYRLGDTVEYGGKNYGALTTSVGVVPAVNPLTWRVYPATGGGGGGAVDSVNGQIGDVVLTKSDIGLANVDNTSDANKPVSTATATALAGKVSTSRAVNAGTGLTGGGDLSADRTLSVVYGSTAGTSAQGDDSRLSDDRDPNPHNHTGADITTGTVAFERLPTGTGATEVAIGSHTHGGGGGEPDLHAETHENGGTDELALDASQITTGTLAIGRIPTGTTGTTVALGNDARFTDDRDPNAHSATHEDGGIDELTLAQSQIAGLAAALAALQPLDSDLTTLAGLASTTDNVIQAVAGVWASRTPAQLKATLALSKSDVGLANVDNTSDVNKPVSTAQQTALDLKVDTTRSISTTAPIAGGGDLSANRTISLNDAGVTNAKLANMAASTIKGNNTAGATAPLDLTVAEVKTLLAYTAADVSAAPTTRTISTTAPLSGGGDLSANRTLTLLDDGVTNAKLDNMPANTLKGNNTGGSANPVDLTVANVKTLLAYTAADVGAQPLDSDLTTLAGLTATTDNFIVAVASAWASRTPAQVKATLAIAQSDVTGLTAALAALQPLDSDLTTIAGLTATTDNVIQSVGSAWASRTPAQLKATLALAKGDVGLANVDNTSDANKPVSTATQTALDLKAPLASPAFTGTATIVNATYSGRQLNTPVPLTSAATVVVNAALGNDFTLTAGQNFTLGNPSNAVNGQKILFAIRQDGTGSRVMTLDTNYRLGADITAVVLSTAINKTDYLGVRYNSTDSKWDVIAFVKGY